MTPELFWIPGPWLGKLAIVTRPRGGDWLEDEADGWRRAGVEVVVSLLESREAAQLELNEEGDVAEAKGLHFIAFPIPDRGVPESTGDAVSMLSNIGRLLEKGKKVAVHCRQGMGRSGLIAASLLVTSGVSADRAINVVSEARGRSIPETPAQFEWIRVLPSQHLIKAS
jgi:protein-tyrosine phosphatase